MQFTHLKCPIQWFAVLVQPMPCAGWVILGKLLNFPVPFSLVCGDRNSNCGRLIQPLGEFNQVIHIRS